MGLSSKKGHGGCGLQAGSFRVRRSYPNFWTYYLKLLAHGYTHENAREALELRREGKNSGKVPEKARGAGRSPESTTDVGTNQQKKRTDCAWGGRYVWCEVKEGQEKPTQNQTRVTGGGGILRGRRQPPAGFCPAPAVRPLPARPRPSTVPTPDSSLLVPLLLVLLRLRVFYTLHFTYCILHFTFFLLHTTYYILHTTHYTHLHNVLQGPLCFWPGLSLTAWLTGCSGIVCFFLEAKNNFKIK